MIMSVNNIGSKDADKEEYINLPHIILFCHLNFYSFCVFFCHATPHGGKPRIQRFFSLQEFIRFAYA